MTRRLPTIAVTLLLATAAHAGAPTPAPAPGSSLVEGLRSIRETPFPTACQQAARTIQDGGQRARRKAVARYRELGCGRAAPEVPVAQQATRADCSFLRHVLNQGNSTTDARLRLRREHDRLCR